MQLQIYTQLISKCNYSREIEMIDWNRCAFRFASKSSFLSFPVFTGHGMACQERLGKGCEKGCRRRISLPGRPQTRPQTAAQTADRCLVGENKTFARVQQARLSPRLCDWRASVFAGKRQDLFGGREFVASFVSSIWAWRNGERKRGSGVFGLEECGRVEGRINACGRAKRFRTVWR